MLNRRTDESELDYHRRLIFGKLVDRTLTDVDYTELAPLLYGQNYSSDVARRMMYGSCKTLQKIDDEQAHCSESESAVSDLDAKRIEIMKERQRFFDQRVAFNKVVRERARQEELNDIIRATIQSGVQAKMLPDLIPAERQEDVPFTHTDLLISLNDIHFGANVKNNWCTYNSDVCWDMIARYLGEIDKIAETHHPEGCVVWANGDLIAGNIHYQIAVSNNENVIQQVVGVSEVIAAFLAALGNRFSYVKYISVAGNHSRIDVKDKALIDERLDDLVEWYLKARLQNYKNIEIGFGDHIDSTMYVANVRGKNYVGVHGDYDPTPQHIQALQTMAERPVYAVLMGHKHHNATGNVQGIRTVMAGSFLGMDDFCVQKRIYGKPEQMVCVCDNRGIMCSYNIDLSP